MNGLENEDVVAARDELAEGVAEGRGFLVAIGEQDDDGAARDLAAEKLDAVIEARLAGEGLVDEKMKRGGEVALAVAGRQPAGERGSAGGEGEAVVLRIGEPREQRGAVEHEFAFAQRVVVPAHRAGEIEREDHVGVGEVLELARDEAVGAGEHAPVEMARIVAGDVGAVLEELGGNALETGAVRPFEKTLDAGARE